MLILFRHSGKKFAYDTVVGSLIQIGALEHRMLEALTPPMAPTCPTALRYDLAKYSSDAVEQAYDALYEKAANGVIFAPENGCIKCPDAPTDVQRAALAAAADVLRESVTPTGNDQELIREILGAKNLIK